MPKFRVHTKRGTVHVIIAQDLDDAERVADRKYPYWENIYIMGFPQPSFKRKITVTAQEEADDL